MHYELNASVNMVEKCPVCKILVFHTFVSVFKLAKNPRTNFWEIKNRSPEFCLKLTYRNLLKADRVPGDTLGKPVLVKMVLFEQIGRGPLGDTTCQIPRL